VDYSALAQQARQPDRGLLGSFADASGISGLGSMLSNPHPIDNALQMGQGLVQFGKQSVQNVKDAASAVAKDGLTLETRRKLGKAVPILGPGLAAAQEQQDAGNTSGAIGTLLGTVAGIAGPKAAFELKEAAPALVESAATKTSSALQTAGEGAQDFAVKRINKTVGSLQKDFEHGANPGRQYLKSGFGASASMDSIATKADNAISDVGKRIGEAYEKASENTPVNPPEGQYHQPQIGPGAQNSLPGAVAKPRIPVQAVFDAIAAPLKNAHDLEAGFGGSGNTGPLVDYANRLAPELDKASARGGFTPKELFDLKQKLTKNINWKSTSDLETKLNNVREAQYSAISSILDDAVPGVKELNRAYGDLINLRKRAQLRASTGSAPLTNFKEQSLAAGAGAALGSAIGGPGLGTVVGGGLGLAADSLPAKTAVATGLYRGGKAMSSAGMRLEDWLRSKR
jgi:hypothetical protein